MQNASQQFEIALKDETGKAMISTNVRVRFAPSPTGEPHVGNMRTAIFNWLFARHSQGTVILRVEDTDQARIVEGAIDQLLASLRWLGIDWDEGLEVGGPYAPYSQSERLNFYNQVIDKLIESNNGYYCYCSQDRLALMRKEQMSLKQPPGYDRHCRDLSDKEQKKAIEDGGKRVARFRMPLDGETEFTDLIRGKVSFENRVIDDFVMLKSDGFPTYHLANVVDDHLMEISHVMRAEEWLPSTPRHLKIYEACGWSPPMYAHLPIILAPDRSKLSKRHGATSIFEYHQMGYLPEALFNFLTLLGWSYDDKTEIMSSAQLIEYFTIERVGKSGSVFSTEKLDWMNGVYIRQMSSEQLANKLMDFWKEFPPTEFDNEPNLEFVERIVPLIQDRMKRLVDAAPLVAFFFKDELLYENDDLVQKGLDWKMLKPMLEIVSKRLDSLMTFKASCIEELLRQLAEELNIKPKNLFGLLRVAVTGQKIAPPLFETIEVLGKDRTMATISEAINKIDENKNCD